MHLQREDEDEKSRQQNQKVFVIIYQFMQKISKLKYSMLGTWLTAISYKLALELNVIKERERERERER